MTYRDNLKQARKKRRKREHDRRKREHDQRKRLWVAAQGVQPCDGCTACCEVLGVEELKKAYYLPCGHCTAHGCGIYEARPKSCQGFYCLYSEGVTTDRPDQCGVLYFLTGGNFLGGQPTLEIYETRQDAFLTQFRKCLSTADNLARKGMGIPYLIFVRFGFPIPTAWDGQNNKVKHLSLGPPNIRYTIRSEHEDEDTQWWQGLLDRLVQEELAAVSVKEVEQRSVFGGHDPQKAIWTGQMPLSSSAQTEAQS